MVTKLKSSLCLFAQTANRTDVKAMKKKEDTQETQQRQFPFLGSRTDDSGVIVVVVIVIVVRVLDLLKV